MLVLSTNSFLELNITGEDIEIKIQDSISNMNKKTISPSPIYSGGDI